MDDYDPYVENLADELREVREENARLLAENRRLREALVNLLGEARGIVGLYGIRSLIGNTNANCLERRCHEADVALSASNRRDEPRLFTHEQTAEWLDENL